MLLIYCIQHDIVGHELLPVYRCNPGVSYSAEDVDLIGKYASVIFMHDKMH